MMMLDWSMDTSAGQEVSTSQDAVRRGREDNRGHSCGYASQTLCYIHLRAQRPKQGR